MTLALAAAGLDTGGRQRLVAVDLVVEPARIHVLLGPNGAGKSSALSLLAGDRPPTRGCVRLEGRDLVDWSALALARRRAVLAQDPPPAFAFRVAELVGLGRLPWQRPADDPSEREIIRHALARVDAEALADRRYAALSGGERARVQLARALAQIDDRHAAEHPPRYLLLDEPAAHLDLAQQHRLIGLLRALAAEGVGILAVLHDPNLAAQHADTISLLHGGRCIASGPPAEVLTAAHLSAAYGLPVRPIRLPDGRLHLQLGDAALSPASAPPSAAVPAFPGPASD